MIFLFEVPAHLTFDRAQNDGKMTDIDEVGDSAREKESAINLRSAEMLALAKVALEAHAIGNLKRRDDTSLDLFARFAGCFARPLVFPPALIKVGDKSVPLDGCRLK